MVKQLVLRRATMAAMLVLLAGCATETGIVVEVTSERTIPKDIDQLSFAAVGVASGRSVTQAYAVSTDWPHSLAILPAGDDDEEVTVTVKGLKEGQVIEETVKQARFVPGKITRLAVVLGPAPASEEDGGLDGGSPGAWSPDALPDSCGNGAPDNDETGVDCGGSCPPCADGQRCNDDDDCTSGVCFDGACVSCTDGIRDGTETGVDCGGDVCPGCHTGFGCLEDGDCLEGTCFANVCVSCQDGQVNGNETDVDCGGEDCPGCGSGQPCADNADCASDRCVQQSCESCTDEIRNGGERGVDCGGPCPGCPDGSDCRIDEDCASLVCHRRTCQVPTCDDHAANGEESDVDCGGSCTDCEIGKACADNNDCVGNLCAGGLCTTEACTNGGQDGSETDVDCGGRQCPPCDLGQTCLGGRDCTTRQCFGGVCSDHSCTDNLHNGAETDIDCGGTDCPGCADGKACLLDGDCANGTCVANLCISCVDGLLNGDETGQDCGGSCPGCAPGQPCDFDADCASNICDSLFQCTSPTCEDSVSNGTESDTDCGGSCPPCALNDRCNDEADCATATCTDGVCAIPSCTDGAQNGDETDIDCGGGTCTGCGDGRQCTADGDCLSSPCLSGTCGDCAAFGTDSFGYVGCASTPPTLPCPDISSTGTNLSLSDDGYQSVSIGFAFDFYGTNYNDATIGSNGLLYFEATSHRFSNVCLPTTTTPAAFVAVFWDDLNPGASPGAVYYESRGTAPNRAFIVQWQVLHYSSSPESIDVRAVLRESSNHIEVCYVDTSFGTATFDQGLSATLGVQGSSTDALTYSCNEARAQAGLLVEYRHP